MSTRVMKFGVRSIIEHDDVAREEMFRAHRYYNALLELKLGTRRKYREIREQYCPQISALESEWTRMDAELTAEYATIRAANRDASKPLRKHDDAKPKLVKLTAQKRERIDTLKAQRKDLAARMREVKAEYENGFAAARLAYNERTSGAPAELLEQIAELGRQIKEAKKTRNNPDVSRLKRAHAELKKRKSDVSPKTAKKASANERVTDEMLSEPQWSAAWKESHRANRHDHAESLRLRSESGLTHGTYVAVEGAVEQAFKTADGDPGFRRFDGGRKIGRQIQGGMTLAEALGGNDSRLQIVAAMPIPGLREKPVERSAISRRNYGQYAIVKFPIGKGGSKTVLSVEVFFHRPIPKDARITWVYLVPRRTGFRTEYSMQFTVETDTPLVQRSPGSGEALVSLRWSRERSDSEAVRDGLIVAEINGIPFALDGAEYRARANYWNERGGAFAGMIYSRALRGHADRQFNRVCTELKSWAEGLPEDAWIRRQISYREATESQRGQQDISQWQNHERLARVSFDWLARLFGEDGDGDAFVHRLWIQWREHNDGMAKSRRHGARKRGDYFPEDSSSMLEFLLMCGVTSEDHRMAIWLDWWRRKDKHLLQWSADTKRKACNNRKDQYRRKAAEMSAQYESVTVRKLDLAAAGRRRAEDSDRDELHRQARYQLQCAAPAEFVEALQLAFGKDRFRETYGDADMSVGSRSSDNYAEFVADGVAAE